LKLFARLHDHHFHSQVAGSIPIRALYQAQLFCPFDGRPAVIDAQFAEDALGTATDCAKSDYELRA